MAIQTRRGSFNDYDPAKMLPAEFATVLQDDPRAVDGKALHVAFAPNVEKTLMTFEDAEAQIEQAATAAVDNATQRAEAAADAAEESARTLTIDDTLTQSGQAADAKAAGDRIGDAENVLNENTKVLFGAMSDDFPMEFENGTYKYVSVGSSLEKYYAGGYDKTRKVLASTVYNATCLINLTARDGYLFSVYGSASGVIQSASSSITKYTLFPDRQYGIILKATNGTDDISETSVSSIIEIEYVSNVDREIANINKDLCSPINLGKTTLLHGEVDFANGTIGTANFLHTDYIDLSGIDRIIYTRILSTSTGAGTGAGMAFYDLNKTYISGQRVVLNQETSKYELTEIAVPNNAVYARFTALFTGEFCVYDYDDYEKKIPLQVDALNARAEAAAKRIELVRNAITITENVDIGSATVIRGLINISNVWSITPGFSSYAFPIFGDYYSLVVSAKENYIASVGFLKNSILVPGTAPSFCDGIDSRIVIQAGTTEEFNIPSDCTFIVIMKEASNVDYTPDAIMFSKWGFKLSDIPLGLHELPSSESVLNIVKRCRQMTDIKWTPAADLPRYMLVQRSGPIPETASSENYLGTFKAGTEYTGIPYGRVSNTMTKYGISYATVGHYIDFETFISSVFNPNSKLCKENVGSVGDHRSVIYASVCSGLTCYALNVSEIPTASIANIPGLAFVGKINDNGTLLDDKNFMIGDVLNKYNDHTAIITDIIRDNEGEIRFVELSDASTAGLADRDYDDGLIGGICRRKGWSRDKLFDPNSWGAYSLYHYTGNVPYTPSPYVNVGDEFNMQRIEHFPCIPYEGNNFRYKTGYIPNNTIKILISLGGYSYLKVFKDGVEITGSPFTVTDETESIDVSVIDPGEYSAYLCNITNGDVVNLAYPCKWTVIE